jgi:hypothetical protein
MRLRNPTLRLLNQVSARLPRRLAQSTVQHTTPIFDIITMCSRSHFAAPPPQASKINPTCSAPNLYDPPTLGHTQVIVGEGSANNAMTYFVVERINVAHERNDE